MIDAATLKSVRKARKVSRPRLARLAGMSERQVARLEGAGPVMAAATPDVTLRIAEALRVDPSALSGSVGVGDQDIQPMSQTTCGSGCGCGSK